MIRILVFLIIAFVVALAVMKLVGWLVDTKERNRQRAALDRHRRVAELERELGIGSKDSERDPANLQRETDES